MPTDLFSAQSQLYAQFRPGYPKPLYDHVLSFVNQKDTAWDCATGNGQAAQELANYFKTVYATDISQAQLSKAVKRDNIFYDIAPAEATSFSDDTFDLITIATAYHWLAWDQFRDEAYRVGKNGCIVAAWCYYHLRSADTALQHLYDHFYKNITGPYWHSERRYVDEQYQTISFDFKPLPAPHFQTIVQWTKEQFTGYLGTWSAVQQYKIKHNLDPLMLIKEELSNLWPGQDSKEFSFPIALRLGCIVK